MGTFNDLLRGSRLGLNIAYGGGGKGGTETKVEIDPDIKKAALENIGIGNEVASIGYVPYSGPTVAGFTPQQMAGMQGADQGAAAFGMPSALGAGGGAGMSQDQLLASLTGMPPTNAGAGGFQGYSAMPLYQQALANDISPAQMDMIKSFFINPQTGAAPVNPAVPAPLYDPQNTRPAPTTTRNPAKRSWLSAPRYTQERK